MTLIGSRRLLQWLALALCAPALVIACGDGAKPAPAASTTTAPSSSSPGTGPGAGDAGGDASTGTAEAGSVTCIVPTLGGPTISARVIAGSPPADTGGTIAPGTYDLTDLEIYVEQGGEDPDGGNDAGAPMGSARATLLLTSDTIAHAKSASPLGGGAPLETNTTGKQHTNDVFLFIDETCPLIDSRQTPFTATATTLTLHSAQLRREVYTRRP